MVSHVTYRMFDILALCTVSLIVVAEKRACSPVGRLLHLRGESGGETLANHTPALSVLRISQDHHAVADGGDDLPAWLPDLGEVVEKKLVKAGRFDNLAHAFVVAAGKEHNIKGVEGKVGRRPCERVLHLLTSRHLLIHRDDVFLRALPGI